MAKLTQADVVIVGAGLVGLTAAVAFAQQNKKVVLVDAKQKAITRTQSGWDARIYALTEASVHWLEMIGVWAHVDQSRINPIRSMQLWALDASSPLVLNADDAHLTQMGSVIENQNLMSACWQALSQMDVIVVQGIDCDALHIQSDQVTLTLANRERISAKLLLAADGANSWVRGQLSIGVQFKAFHQTAVVANFSAENPHADCARQWFGVHETLALLPLPEQIVSLVWSLSTERAHALLRLSEGELGALVQERTKRCLGQLTQIGTSAGFSLSQQTAHQLISHRVVLVGDAAHQVHPMAGQGVNLGFGDVMKLTELTTKLNAMQDVGDVALLRQYERARKPDILQMNMLTSSLDAMFASQLAVLPKVAGWGMQVFNRHDVIKKYLIAQATL
ncbi:MAG: FAD-dependent oxidoreductase [Methylophilus sp.]|nr:FAD-dependent oxidoreductase [Methylophilus sp.]